MDDFDSLSHSKWECKGNSPSALSMFSCGRYYKFPVILHRKRTSLAVWTCRLSLSKRSNRTMTAVRGDRLKTQVGVVTYFLAGRRSTVGVMSRGSSGRSKCGETFHRCPASVSTLTVFRL